MIKTNLSIVVPVFNRKELVRELLDSCLSNSYQDWELLCVDDGSTDGCQDVLREYSEKDGRISFIERTTLPKGGQTCRNIGLERAIGEYIMFFDSDDIIADFCFEQRVSYMKEHPELDFAVFPNENFYEKIGDSYDNPKLAYCGGVPLKTEDLKAFAACSLPFVVWNNIYKTSSLRKNNICWDDKLLSLQDSAFNLTCILTGLKYRFASLDGANVDYYFRTPIQSASVSKRMYSKEHYSSHVYFANTILGMFPEKWKKDNRKYVKFFFIHKLMLLRFNPKDEHIVDLLRMAKENGLSLFSWKIYYLLRYKFNLKDLYSQMIAFPDYILYVSNNRHKRNDIVRVIAQR